MHIKQGYVSQWCNLLSFLAAKMSRMLKPYPCGMLSWDSTLIVSGHTENLEVLGGNHPDSDCGILDK